MTAATSTVPVTSNLVLVRLLVPGKKSPMPGKVKESLAPFFQHQGSPAEWASLFDEALQDLEASGLVTKRPLALTEQGRRQALDFLGLATLPPRVSWRTLKNSYLVARALDLPTPSSEDRKHWGEKESFRALVLKKQYHLPTADFPTLRQALDALAWKQLNISSSRPFTLEAVLNHFLGLPAQLKMEELKVQLPAKATGAQKCSPDGLHLAILRRWIEGKALDRAPTATQSIPKGQSFNLAGFAQGVLEAARAIPAGRFGDNKVFICHVWRKLQEEGAFPGTEEAEFKHLLIEANRQGLLALSRADLVEAMDPQDVSASETRYLNATFHFIQI